MWILAIFALTLALCFEIKRMIQVIPVPFCSFPLVFLPTGNHHWLEDDNVIPLNRISCLHMGLAVNSVPLLYELLNFI